MNKPKLESTINDAIDEYNKKFRESVFTHGSGEMTILLQDMVKTLESIKQVCLERGRF